MDVDSREEATVRRYSSHHSTALEPHAVPHIQETPNPSPELATEAVKAVKRHRIVVAG